MAADSEEPATEADERDSGDDGGPNVDGDGAANSGGPDTTDAADDDGGDLPPATEREPTVPPAFEEYATDDLPNATPRGHGKDGVLEATLGRSGDGPTRLLRDRAEVPLHLTGTLGHDPLGPTLCVQEPTGGVAQGDRHRIAVEAGERARGVVTAQSATKVHSMHSDYAHLDVALEIGSGAHLEYVPGATILNEGARCLSTTRVDLARGATAIVADVLVPDGLTDHPQFGFDHYHARLDARHECDLASADAVDLRPDERDPRNPSTVGEANAVGTLYVLAPDAADDEVEAGASVASIDDLADRLHERAVGTGPDGTDADGTNADGTDADGTNADGTGGDGIDAEEPFRAGASTLPFGTGVCVRAIGARTDRVEAALTAARDEARQALFDVGVPADRRY